MVVKIKDTILLVRLIDFYGFSTATSLVNHLLETYEQIIKDNNYLLNQNMIYKLENEMLKNR